MAKINQEGTFFLDGLIEGPFFGPEDQDGIERLVQNASRYGIKLNVSSDGGRFSILPGLEVVNLRNNRSARELIVKLLEQWLADYSDDECRQLMSTLRSSQYVPGKELQVIYGIRPDGIVAAEEREVDADTVAPPEPMDPKVLKKIITQSVIAVVVLIALSTLFVPYRELGDRFWQSVKPYDPSGIIVANSHETIMPVQSLEYLKKENRIQVKFKLPIELLIDPGAIEKKWQSESLSLAEKLSLEAIARRTIICDCLDQNGSHITRLSRRIYYIKEKPGMAYIVIPFDRAINAIELY